MTDITAADLQPWNDPDDLLDRLTRLLPNQLEEFRAELRSLIDHPDADVREQAVRRLFVHLSDSAEHDRVLHLLKADPSANVRRAAAFGLYSVSSPATRDRDASALLSAFLGEGESHNVMGAAYEALLLLFSRLGLPPGDRAFDASRDVDWHWIETLRERYQL